MNVLMAFGIFAASYVLTTVYVRARDWRHR